MYLQAQITVFIVSNLLMTYKADALNPSLIQMLSVIETEGMMINTLERYVEAENQKLQSLKKFNEVRQSRQNSTMDGHEFASNSLAVFSMFRYLTSDFENLRMRMTENTGESVISAMSQEPGIVLPSLNDFHRVILNLVHLQRVYDVEISKLIRDDVDIFDRMSNGTLSVDDCIEIGKVCSKYNKHYAAVQWLNECLRLIPGDNFTIERMLWNLLGESYIYLGRKDFALTCLDNSIATALEGDRNIDDLKRVICTDLNNWDDCGFWDDAENTSYRACRGDFSDETLKQKLKCRYNHSNSPFLILAPLKEEELSVNPKVVLYRDAIYNSEIELLKMEAKEKLRDALVLKPDSTIGPNIHYRPAQTTFLDTNQPQYWNLGDRLQDLSGLSLDYGDTLQVLNYAPGGYYRVHRDNIATTGTDFEYRGQRVATALFYMNDVPLGGGTAFPLLKLHIQPVKGTVLFWSNILEDETEEPKVTHAACPVIYGEKWAFTYWFRGHGQSFWNSIRTRDNMFRWDPASSPKFWRG